jgi:hypothetical protein
MSQPGRSAQREEVWEMIVEKMEAGGGVEEQLQDPRMGQASREEGPAEEQQ